MVVKCRNKEVELKYTFNSFKYMTDFSASAFEEIDDKPFKVLGILEILLLGALNHDKKVRFTTDDVDDVLESMSENGDLAGLLEHLMGILQESGFFKGLQKKQK